MKRLWPLGLLLLSAAAHAAQGIESVRYNSGTGFFVSPEGYLLTNAHVIRGCSQYSLYTPYSIMRATLVSDDEKQDLALLKSEMPPANFGRFRNPQTPLAVGEKVSILGYPAEAVKARKPSMRDSQLISLGGPNNEQGFIQFASSMQQGNSGGPLFDGSGNIIGVVSAKSKVTAINTETRAVKSVQYADVAIAQPAVLGFLGGVGVAYEEATSDKPLTSKDIARSAGDFVVNVRCRIN